MCPRPCLFEQGQQDVCVLHATPGFGRSMDITHIHGNWYMLINSFRTSYFPMGTFAFAVKILDTIAEHASPFLFSTSVFIQECSH